MPPTRLLSPSASAQSSAPHCRLPPYQIPPCSQRAWLLSLHLCLCSFLIPKLLPSTSPAPRNTTLPQTLCSQHPTGGGSRSPLLPHLHYCHVPGPSFLWQSHLTLKLRFPWAFCLPGFRGSGNTQIVLQLSQWRCSEAAVFLVSITFHVCLSACKLLQPFSCLALTLPLAGSLRCPPIAPSAVSTLELRSFRWDTTHIPSNRSNLYLP